MLHIQINSTISPKIENFYKKVWETADQEYYGRKIDWSVSKRIVEAYDNNELVSVIELHLQAGVMLIFELAVAYSHHKKDIGTMLVHKAEKIAKEEKLHKIYLETGKTWGTAAFYEKLEYVKTAEIPMHHGGQDYLQYSKLLTYPK